MKYTVRHTDAFATDQTVMSDSPLGKKTRSGL